MSVPAVPRAKTAPWLPLVLGAALLTAALGAAGARPARDADSLLAALRATDAAVIVRVHEAPHSAAGGFSVDVLDVLRGTVARGPLRPHAGPAGCGAAERPLAPGATSLLLLSRTAEGWACDAHHQASYVDLAPSERTATAGLVGRIATALERGDTGSKDLGALLREHVDFENPVLRRCMLFDLATRLGPDDLPFLLDLSTRAHPEDVRAWAILSIAEVTETLPAEVGDRLAPDESESVRQAVLQLLGRRRRAEDLPLFARALGDPDATLRRTAVENLVVRDAVPLLLARFEEERDFTVRTAIVRKLGEIGGSTAANGLASIARRTQDPNLQREAELWLAALRERGEAP